MTIVICADKNGGILFNDRRQSRDSKLIEDLVAFAKNRRILSVPYSEKLFANTDADLCFCPDYLDKAGENDVCFVEKEDFTPYLSAADELVVYRWNKVYPADRFFSPPFHRGQNIYQSGYRELCQICKFEGYNFGARGRYSGSYRAILPQISRPFRHTVHRAKHRQRRFRF